MKRRRVIILVGVLGLVALLLTGSSVVASPPWRGPDVQDEVITAALVDTAINYQGRLTDRGGNPLTGTYDFQFRFYDAATGGTVLGSTVVTGVTATDGLFNLKIGVAQSWFHGQGVWLQVSTRPSGGTWDPWMTPRQEILPVPYALALPGLWTQQNVESPNLIGGYRGNSVTSGVVGATISGGGAEGHTNRVTDGYGTVGGGRLNLAGDADADPADALYATVGGGYDNDASGYGCTVGGGENNTTSRSFATVGGGVSNTASGTFAMVGGGFANTATDHSATVGGGYDNTASGSYGATVGGGYYNEAIGDYATVSGGYNNTVTGFYATVGGGYAAMATHYGEMAYASGSFGIPGDAQGSLYVMRNTTTDATQTELFLDGSSERLTIAPDRTVAFEILVVARSDGGASAGYRIRGVIENVGGTTTTIGATGDVLGEDVASWDAIAAADTTNDALVIKVTGATGTIIRWVATVRTAEAAW